MLTRLLLLVLILLTSVGAIASDSKTSSLPQAESYQQYEGALNSLSGELEQVKKQLLESARGMDGSIARVDAKAEIQAQQLRERLDSIESKLVNYKDSLEALKVEGVNESLGMNFSVWTGILLASVAAIVTTLGVVIAIGSIFGYKKIMDSSRQEAERVAKVEANQVAKDEIAERIRKGEFNALVMEAVDRVAFGNINSNNEYEFDEKKDSQ